MNDETSWTNTDMADDGRKAFYRANVQRAADLRREARMFRWQSLVLSIGGMLIGAAGLAYGFDIQHRTPLPEPPGYLLVHDADGSVGPAISAVGAPRLFTEVVRRRAMVEFIKACEGYIPETFARLDYHACLIHASPLEQRRREAEIGKAGLRYPPRVFGPNGWAMPTDFPDAGFVDKDGTGARPYKYQVRYRRIEVVNGRETIVPYTADIVFDFHPEAKMTAPDRLLNETGFVAISASFIKD